MLTIAHRMLWWLVCGWLMDTYVVGCFDKSSIVCIMGMFFLHNHYHFSTIVFLKP